MSARSKSLEELYLYVKGSPLVLNILGLVSETARGLTVSEISAKLAKMPPSVSRSVSKLVRMGLLESVSVGRNKYFKVKSGIGDTVRKLVDDSVKTAMRPPTFKLLSLEGSVGSIVATELQGVLGKQFDIGRSQSVSGKHLEHSFDIVLRNSKKVAIEIVHASNVKSLFEKLGMWSDLAGTEIQLIILIILGGIKQPYKSFFENLDKGTRPRIEPIFVETSVSELNDNVIRKKIAEPIVEMITSLKRR